MKIFSKQKDEDFIIEEPENIMINNFGKNTPVVLHELTAEEILNSNQAAQPRFDGQSALKSLKQNLIKLQETREELLGNNCLNLLINYTQVGDNCPICKSKVNNKNYTHHQLQPHIPLRVCVVIARKHFY